MICEHCCNPMERYADLAGSCICERCLRMALTQLECVADMPAPAPLSEIGKEIEAVSREQIRARFLRALGAPNPLYDYLVRKT